MLVTLLSEGALLVVAAQAGFIGGPRGLANMAHDSWMPRWFANLSERLASHNGIMLMGLAALAALVYTGGNVSTLVIMYSINVFVTFSLSMIGMCRHWYQLRGRHPLWRRRLACSSSARSCASSILGVTVVREVQRRRLAHDRRHRRSCVRLCFFINRYYREVGASCGKLDETLGQLVDHRRAEHRPSPTPTQPTAVILVGGYSGLGIHTMLNAIRFAPDHFQNFVFISVGVVDSGNFKGTDAVDDLRQHTEDSRWHDTSISASDWASPRPRSWPSAPTRRRLEQLCLEVARRFPKSVVFAGQLVFQKDTWLHRLLHNQTAYSLQRRLQWAGIPMVILPTRVR